MSLYHNLEWTVAEGQSHFPKSRTPVNNEHDPKIYCRKALEQAQAGKAARWHFGGSRHRMVCAWLYRWIRKQPEGQVIIAKTDFYKEVFPEEILDLWVTDVFVGRIISMAIPYRWSRQLTMNAPNEPFKRTKRQMAILLMNRDDLVYGLEEQMAGWWKPFCKKAGIGDEDLHDWLDDFPLQRGLGITDVESELGIEIEASGYK